MKNDPKPIMPQATAVWLIDNTALTFAQIASFVGMHELEIQAIADGEIHANILGADPIELQQLTKEEIKRCEQDSASRLKLSEGIIALKKNKKHKKRYTPISLRRNKINAIAWLIQNQRELADGHICSLLKTTRPTIKSVRDGTHWDDLNIEARHPVELGLVTRQQYDEFLRKIRTSKTKKEKEKSEA